MNDEHRQQLLDQYEEAALTLLMDEYAEADGVRLWKEFENAQRNGEVPEIPAELDAHCQKLIQNSLAHKNSKDKFHKVVRILGKVAVSVLVFLGLATTAVLSVDALRVPVLNFFLHHSEKFSSVTFHEPNEYEEIQCDVINKAKEVPLPDGYVLSQQVIGNDGSIKILYENNSEHIIALNVTPSIGQISIDTEAVNQIELKIYDFDAIFIEKDGYRVIWFDVENNFTYSLYADNLESDYFWKLVYRIAE